MASYSRLSPSPRYLALGEAYRELHLKGDGTKPADNTFDGVSLLPHFELIGNLIRHFKARTLLDYGSGKGKQYGKIGISTPDGRKFPDLPSFWGVEVTCYDPGHAPFSQWPGRRFDAVICTDVLEHCPEEDLDWIVGEIFASANQFVYANAANYPAEKCFANGENVHITLRPTAWWTELFQRVAAGYPGVQWLLLVQELYEEDGQKKTRFDHAGTIRVKDR